jgi:hypothetical protein
MSKNCPHCGRSVDGAVSISLWYMHDNHTFTRLDGGIDAAIAKARELGVESPCGMLGKAVLVDAEGRDVRRVGNSIHAKHGFTESDLLAWRESVLADAEAARLLALAVAS